MNETKAAPVEIKLTGDDLGPNEFLAVMSAPTIDRDGEVIDSGAFDPLPEKIAVDIDHALSVEKVVASGRPFYDRQGKLMVRGMFASTQLAQDVRTLVREGHVDRMSVTFRAAQRETNAETGVVHIKSAELLNVAFVVVPSNRDAAVLAAKQPALASDVDRLADAVKQLAQLADQLTAKLDALDQMTSTATAPDAGPELAAADAVADRPPARQRSAAVDIARARLALA